ncbi:MAG: HIT family protein [Bdellovibrio sp.]
MTEKKKASDQKSSAPAKSRRRARAVKAAAKTTNSRSAVGSSASLVLGSETWPLERDVLFRPDRLKYIRKLIKQEGCVFCNAAQKPIGFDSLCVFKSKHSMVVLNKFPYNSGHILILPQRHCGDLLELTPVEWADLSELIRTSMKVVKKTYEPAGFNAGLNHGAVAGAGIPEHLHFHLIPRWAGDLNFFPLIAETKVVIENLETSFERLIRGFTKVGGLS